MLIFFLTLIGVGALLAVVITLFGSLLAPLLTGLLAILSFAINLIGLSIIAIFFFLYFLLPFDTYLITVACLVVGLVFICWYHADKSQNQISE